MIWREAIRRLRKNPIDGWYFIQGTTRYWLYQKAPALLRAHIVSQYEWRKRQAIACYQAGECKCCKCRTPELFFANKPCSAGNPAYLNCKTQTPCYQAMMNQWEWALFKEHYIDP